MSTRSCLQANGTIAAWGLNTYGQIGNGLTSNQFAPMIVPGLTNFIQISAGDSTSFAVRADGTVWSWGKGQNGQLGINYQGSKSSPNQVFNVARGDFRFRRLRLRTLHPKQRRAGRLGQQRQRADGEPAWDPSSSTPQYRLLPTASKSYRRADRTDSDSMPMERSGVGVAIAKVNSVMARRPIPTPRLRSRVSR